MKLTNEYIEDLLRRSPDELGIVWAKPQHPKQFYLDEIEKSIEYFFEANCVYQAVLQ